MPLFARCSRVSSQGGQFRSRWRKATCVALLPTRAPSPTRDRLKLRPSEEPVMHRALVVVSTFLLGVAWTGASARVYPIRPVQLVLYEPLPYDPLRDFEPVAMIARSSAELVVNPSVPANSVQELIGFAKAPPGKPDFGTASSNFVIDMDRFKQLTGTDFRHLSLRGFRR